MIFTAAIYLSRSLVQSRHDTGKCSHWGAMSVWWCSLLASLSYADLAAQKGGWNYRREYFSMMASVSQCGAL
jgi:hypothetical protein